MDELPCWHTKTVVVQVFNTVRTYNCLKTKWKSWDHICLQRIWTTYALLKPKQAIFSSDFVKRIGSVRCGGYIFFSLSPGSRKTFVQESIKEKD